MTSHDQQTERLSPPLFIFFLLPLTILVAISTIFGPGLFANTAGSDSSTAFGAI